MYEGPITYESHVTDYFLLGVGVFLSVFLIVFSLVTLAKIFRKADKKFWAGFVPFYNIFVLLEITNLPSAYFFLLLIPVVQIYPLVKICQGLAKTFKKSSKFAVGLFFLPFIFYPILAFSQDKYIGINEEKVEEVVIHDLIRERVDTTQPSTILKTNQNVSVGTTNTAASTSTQTGVLQADASILQQPKPQTIEYIECPVCKNKVKKGAPVCFICGHKF